MNPHDVKAAIQETLRGNTHITVTAPTGGGKSYFVGLLLEQAYAARKPWIVLDTSDRNHIGLIQLKGVTPLKIRKTENPDYSQLLTRPFILCYPDDEMEIDDLIEEYRKIIQALLRAQKPRIICVEECHYYQKSAHQADKNLERISRIGRKYGITGWFITQRCQDFPKILWSGSRYYMIMRYYLHTDKSYLSNQINRFEEINEELNPFDVLVYNSERDQHIKLEAAAIKDARVTKHYG